ncbi:fibronectin type III domain-containing protein [Bacteroides acidifaciens]|uniref:fibronectin type III domain-containing protein n=1 Tax=Bacteroides acidifaciens TaxID=85831 RepID=UPI0023CE8F72|nr:fibronectin type III domain-containing protein [Bacteroides acidifaciens]MDE6822286.1 fibronectin type III domain-containing protein [Bacteroides acidifaciens]
MRTIRKNFWKPFLFGCVGLFVAIVVFAANPFEEPSAPGTPVAVDWGGDYCEIEFTPPLSDGGAPVTHYIVQGLDKYSPSWVEKGKYIPTTEENKRKIIRCRVNDLIEGYTYYFRAIAVNKAGPSEPSGVSQPITIKKR